MTSSASTERWQALYAVRIVEPTTGVRWDFTWTTKLDVIDWVDTTLPGDAVVSVHGFVMDPRNVGVSGALVQADHVVIDGADGRDQHFVTYTRPAELDLDFAAGDEE